MNKFFIIIYLMAVWMILSAQDRPDAITIICSATAGSLPDKVAVEWEPVRNIKQYAVYRACKEAGPFNLVATVPGNSFEDTAAEPGFQYWYQVSPVIDNAPVGPGPAAAGYRRVTLPTSLDIDRLIKAKKEPAPRFAEKEQKEKDAQYRALLQTYYMHPAELNVVLHIMRSYVKKGAVLALAGFHTYDLNYEARDIILIEKHYAHMVQFNSSKFFRMLVDGHMRKLIDFDRRDLVDILVDNMTAFCVFREERTITDGSGCARIVPVYDAVGITTELYKNYKEWKNKTLVFGTGNKELEKRIQDFRQLHEN